MLACLYPWAAMATTLQQAMDIASGKHPQLRMAEQALEAARADLTEQSAYAYNPQLSLEPQRRKRNGGGTSNDYYITLSQGVELGGKQGYRQQSAQANVDAVGQRAKATYLRLQTEAARAFVDLYYAQKTLLLRQQQRDVLHQVSQAVKQQLVVGESSQLDANLASSAYTAALNAAVVAQQALTQARMTYASALGQAQSSSELVLPQLATDWQAPPDAYEVALASRPDLASMRAQRVVSNAQAELAGAQQIPDITISAMSGREAGDQLVKLGVSVPFPVFNNHKGAYRAALARADQVKTGLAWAEQQLRMSVKAALTNHHEAMQALAGMTNADEAARSTLTLARQAYDAGELDLEELVVHIRQSLDARLTVVEIMQQAWLARIGLAEVLGHPEYILQGSK
ncbi:Outer membrane efflux protein [Mariprofundus ferrooxydans PV-1]|uniref:Outer membrane efflux protein n=2 Tax=Mariprofundus ferrooxydans TaxID=314344 RepID=Q0F1P0_9PROT|nr:Outer membrane efflux protein [Mariprofundus ferrooxydans PV-1]